MCVCGRNHADDGLIGDGRALCLPLALPRDLDAAGMQPMRPRKKQTRRAARLQCSTAAQQKLVEQPLLLRVRRQREVRPRALGDASEDALRP